MISPEIAIFHTMPQRRTILPTGHVLEGSADEIMQESALKAFDKDGYGYPDRMMERTVGTWRNDFGRKNWRKRHEKKHGNILETRFYLIC